jgi:hypothetical protein
MTEKKNRLMAESKSPPGFRAYHTGTTNAGNVTSINKIPGGLRSIRRHVPIGRPLVFMQYLPSTINTRPHSGQRGSVR